MSLCAVSIVYLWVAISGRTFSRLECGLTDYCFNQPEASILPSAAKEVEFLNFVAFMFGNIWMIKNKARLVVSIPTLENIGDMIQNEAKDYWDGFCNRIKKKKPINRLIWKPPKDGCYTINFYIYCIPKGQVYSSCY